MNRPAASHPIPLIVCEEHHEAYCAWGHAIRRGWMPPEGNALLHFDEHADTALPRLTEPPPDIGGDQGALAAWVYRELRIDDFIVPALYRGIFDRFEWFRRRPAGTVRRTRIFTASLDGAGRRLVYGQWLARTRRQAPADARIAFYRMGDAAESPLRRRNVVLDFDLDYFLCHPRPVFAERRVYLSREEFTRITGNRYHFLLTAPGSHVNWGEERGRNYLEFGAASPASGEKEDLAAAEERVAGVGAFLARQRWRPRLIVVARSRHSGYTPAAHWRSLEEKLLGELGRLYPLAVKSIDELPGGEGGS